MDDKAARFCYPIAMDVSTPLQVLVAIPSGLMGDALISFLRAVPGVHICRIVTQAGELLVGLQETQPDILLLDMSLDAAGKMTGLLRQVNAANPGMSVVALVEDVAQQQLAQASGAAALFKGQLGERLSEMLLSRKDSRNKMQRRAPIGES